MCHRKLYSSLWKKNDTVSDVYLRVGAVLPLALATGEQIGLSASGSCHLMVPDSLFGQVLPHFLQLITGHFLERKKRAKNVS